MAETVWKSIEVDEEVFEFLQRKARPLVESANDVLRRCLLRDRSAPKKPRQAKSKIEHVSGGPLVTSEMFVQMLLAKKFGFGFEQVNGYTYMFERADELVYFQNYNKSDEVLWYRIHKRPRASLRSADKTAWLIFTNPSERFAYVIPMSAVETAVERAGWSRDYFEVHIDTRDNRWTELDWDISRYRQISK